jgi:ketosteroid isomerase-like protein
VGCASGEAERALTPTLLEVERDKVLVLWRQRAVDRAGDVTLDLPAASIYDLRDGRVVRAQMFQDTAAVLSFLGVAAQRRPTEGSARSPDWEE